MSGPTPRTRIWLITVTIATVILYGSLYPFEFRIPLHGIGPLATLLGSWDERPGRGDFIANILLYLPFGFFFLLGFRPGRHRNLALLLAVLSGALLSASVELTQYYDEGRVTSASDVYSNTLGALLGAIIARPVGASFRLPFIGQVATKPIPTLLILAWLSYRMYPYVPTIDLHKYWNALKPLVLTPSLSAYDLFRQTTIWLSLYALIEALVGRRQSFWVPLLFVGIVLSAKILIINTSLRWAELAGAGLAFGIWLLLLVVPARLRAGLTGLVLCAYIVALRLEPFKFQTIAHSFNWIPFSGFMQGSLQVDSLAFLEKFFLYGSALYLLGQAVRRRLPVTVFVAAVLFATSWAETYLPNRSAEITDGLMALMLAMIFALLPPERDMQETGGPLQPADGERRLRDWQREQARTLGVKIDG